MTKDPENIVVLLAFVGEIICILGVIKEVVL